MEFLKAFVVGGLFCAIAHILVDNFKIPVPKVLIGYVCFGCVMGGLGVYAKLVGFAGMGAVIPITGLGFSISTGLINEINNIGLLGVFTGGAKAIAPVLGVTLSIAFISALIFKIFKIKDKN